MANPQVENGHIRIANDLWEAWCRVGSPKDRVFKAILRLTWGWNRKAAAISQKELGSLTGIESKSFMSKLTAQLVNDGMVVKVTAHGKPTEYGPVKDYEEWTIHPVESTYQSESTLPQVMVSTLHAENGSTLSPENTPSINKTMIKPEESHAPDLDPHYLDDLPIYTAYRAAFLNGGELTPSQKRRARARMIELRFEEAPLYPKLFGTTELAEKGIQAWIDKKMDTWSEKCPRQSIPSLEWIMQDYRCYFDENAEVES